MSPPPLCPNCKEPPTSTVERVTALADIRWKEDGSIEYTGDSDVDWNSQHTILSEGGGETLFHCGNCHREFFATTPEVK